MINLAPSAVDALAESATKITSGISKNVPIVGNAAICADSICTTGRAGINFYCLRISGFIRPGANLILVWK